MALTVQVGPCRVDFRSSARACVSMETTMRELGDNGSGAHVLDLSSEGFMAESDGRFVTGSYVWIKLPDVGLVSAKVIWSRGGRVGARFTAPLSRPDYRHLAAFAA
jgi:hypothetical protein